MWANQRNSESRKPSTTESPINALSNRIATAAATISAYNAEHDHPHKSFEPNSPASLLPGNAPYDVQAAQRSLVNAAVNIVQLAQDPADYLSRQSIQFHQLFCLRWLCNFDILPRVPSKGSVSFAQLASAARVPIATLKAVARMAMTNNILVEPTTGQVAHSAISRAITENPTLYDWAKFMGNASVPTAYRFPEATAKWGSTTEKNQTAYNIAMETDLPFFDHLATDQQLTAQFAGYMKNLASNAGTSIEHLHTGFDWASLPQGSLVVDVGGSGGHCSISLANAYPQLNFIVEDLGDTIESSKPDPSEYPSDRISFQPHDFFTSQPIRHGDVYLLRTIIHDWPFAESVKILRHLTAAMEKPDARIVIMDTLLPPPGSVPKTDEALMRLRDLTMRQTFNSKEREMDDWQQLLAEAGLQIAAVKQPPGAVMAVLEVIRAPGWEKKILGEEATNGVTKEVQV